MATFRKLPLANFDSPWLLPGEPNGRLSKLDVDPSLKRVELLRRRAKCSTSGKNPGRSKPATAPTKDTIRVVGIRKNETADPAVYAQRAEEIRWLNHIPMKFAKANTDGENRNSWPTWGARHLHSEFLDNGAEPNILRTAQESARSSESGLKNTSDFAT